MTKKSNLKTFFLTILVVLCLAMAAGVYLYNYFTAVVQVEEDAKETGMRLIQRSGQMFMVSTEKFHDQFNATNDATEKEKVRVDWFRTIRAVDQAVINDFGKDQTRVRLLGDAEITGNPPLGGKDTEATLPYEREVLKRFAAGEAGPIIVNDETQGALRTAVPLRSNMHPGCAECHQLPISSDELLGAVVAYVPITKKLDDAITHSLMESGILTIVSLAIVMFLYWILHSRIFAPIEELRNTTLDLSEGNGDLTYRVPVNRQDEIGELGDNFNRFIGKLQSVFGEVIQVTEGVTQASDQSSAASAKTAQFMDTQNSQTQSVMTAITEMETTAGDMAKSTAETADFMQQADNQAKAGIQQVSDTSIALEALAEILTKAESVVHRLENDSNNIGGILDVIRNIAEQTNLLALNAAIEAARAGDQGRGFAVVADEVRTLAQRTQTSIEEIEQMIERLQSAAKEAAGVMSTGYARGEETVQKSQQATQALNSAMEAFSSISERNFQIASAAEQQSATVSEITRNVGDINQLTQQTSQEAHDASNTSADLRTLSQTLSQLMSRFKV